MPARPVPTLIAAALALATTAVAADSPVHGAWAFRLPDGNPAWLKVEPSADGPTAKLLWSVGSARPVSDLAIDGNTLTFTRKLNWKPGGEPPAHRITAPFKGEVTAGGELALTATHTNTDTGASETFTVSGKPIPPLPPKPDLAKVKFGEPVDLLADGLDGWELTNSKKKNGWRMHGPILVNQTPKKDFSAYGSYGNLRTKREFTDFVLTIDYLAAAGANSGIYLRGMYEAQVVDRDSKMQGINGPGAIFGRIAPSKNAANPPGEWNTYRLTLVDRHITVELNGHTVIDNQPLEGCTGGGMQADDTAPGPLFLQGDHTSIQYRNIHLRPRLP